MGSIVNHMSTDVDKVVQLLNIVHESWSAVLEVTLAIVLLYAEVKYAIFASIGVIVVVMGLIGACSPFLGKTQDAFMEQSDHRMKLITETVNYIKSIKLYAWEPYFMNKISEARANQLVKLRHFYSFIAIVVGLISSLTAFCTFTTLVVYTYIAPEDAPLDMRRIFTTITLINMLETPLSMAEHSVSTVVTGVVSFKRLRSFLSSEEIDDENVQRNADATASEFAYEVQDGTFGWYSLGMIQTATEKKEKERKQVSKEKAKDEKHSEKRTIVSHGSESSIESLDMESEPSERSSSPSPSSENERDNMGPVLHDINLKIKRGSLTAVVGRVGEGKSSLVGALLGEMYKYKGTVRTYGSLAYVPQSAWIMNDTVRNNILFGRPYDKERYLKTIRACALAPDFKMLVNSDKTLIGEKGINLSGGQKQRISIARAVYADADVYIFDDPLSAVDAHVSDHIFVHVLTTILANKTRILVTNAVNRLQDADQIVVIKQGKISQDGQYNELVQNEEGDLFRLIQESKSTGSNNEEQTDNKASEIDEGSITEDYDEDNSIETASATSEERGSKLVKTKTREEDVDLEAKDEVDDEVTAEGRAGWAVYKFYLSALGTFGVISFLAIVAVYMGLLFGVQLWLRRWGHDNDTGTPKHSAHYWILTYFGWTLAGALMVLASLAYPLLYMARSASKYLHAAMLKPLIRSPMSFFDVTSSGKIVNRFAHDISAIDMDLPQIFVSLLLVSTLALQIFIFCIAATPYFAIIMIPIGFGYYLLGGYFIVSSRELKRLDSAARSPMYAHFGETLAGLTSIRAFQDSDRFAIDATSLLDRSQQTSYLSNATTRWLQIMLDTISVLIISVVALMAVVQRGREGAGLFSIVLSQIGILTPVMGSLLSTVCSMETAIISVERVREYSQLTPEARDVIPDSKTDEAWPQTGKIEFNNYSTRYREGLDLVLKDLSLTIQGGERIGIVGRTGAGKSSVTLSLFRIVEAVEGSITIDGIDISTLGLHELRSRITIIPQDPFLFGASIRSNLDPFDKYTDADIWEALESASLKPYIQTLPEGLSTMIDNGGENMSLGQRQLMSLARAMLAKNTRILCLDEATAAIDIETDNAIQRALRRGFSNCTVLTIAHRINTIMDSDRILVLDKGRVAEFDSPKTLLQNKESIFFSLANTSGHA
ncbi:P-loop containing nucleoside triphosphate hydrolase protein [Mortierella sp. GBAus27b]|nr:P-loop containing nucleoside triphosphate hydrolase protein [Mortierella sp. GBAus27b]